MSSSSMTLLREEKAEEHTEDAGLEECSQTDSSSSMCSTVGWSRFALGALAKAEVGIETGMLRGR